MSKVLVLANHYNTLRIFRRELLIAMSEAGHEVIVAIPPADEVNIRILESYGCSVMITKMDRRGINPFKDGALLVRYLKLLKKIKPDKVITYTIKPNIYGSFACKLRKIPHYVNITGLGSAFQGQGLMRKLISFLYKHTMGKASRIFFENEGNRNALVQSGIVRLEQSMVLPGAGVNLEEFAFCDYPDSTNPLRFLFVGRLMKDKGIDELFYAIRKIKAEYPRLLLDCVGWYEDDYQSIVETLQNEGLIAYHGFQSDIKPFIENCHCVVLPSYHEGMSNSLLEAASMGRPLITTDIHGCREAVEEGKNGFLCQVRDGEALYTSMRRFVDLSYDEKRTMGENARELMERDFDKTAVVEQTLDEIFTASQRERIPAVVS